MSDFARLVHQFDGAAMMVDLDMADAGIAVMATAWDSETSQLLGSSRAVIPAAGTPRCVGASATVGASSFAPTVAGGGAE